MAEHLTEAEAIAEAAAAVINDPDGIDLKWTRIRIGANALISAYNVAVGCSETVSILKKDCVEPRAKVELAISQIEQYEKLLRWAKKLKEKEDAKELIEKKEEQGIDDEAAKTALMSRITYYRNKLERVEIFGEAEAEVDKLTESIQWQDGMIRRWVSVKKAGFKGASEKYLYICRKQLLSQALSKFDRTVENITRRLMETLEQYRKDNESLWGFESKVAIAEGRHSRAMERASAMKSGLAHRLSMRMLGNPPDKFAAFIGFYDVTALGYLLRFMDQDLLECPVRLLFYLGQTAEKIIKESVIDLLKPYCHPSELNIRWGELYSLQTLGKGRQGTGWPLTLVEVDAKTKSDLKFKS